MFTDSPWLGSNQYAIKGAAVVLQQKSFWESFWMNQNNIRWAVMGHSNPESHKRGLSEEL